MIERKVLKLLLVGTLLACTLSAQDSTSFLFEAKQLYSSVSDDLVKSAEEMPAKYYGFQPTADSPSFSDLIGEAVASQSDVCSAIQGKHVAFDGPSSGTKTELVSMLTRSVRNCVVAYNSVNNFNADQQVRFGGTQHSRLGLLFMNAGHDDEIYGRISVYLRLKGLVPPADRARMVPVAAH